MKIAAFSESFGQRIKNVVEMFDPQDTAQPFGNKAAILSGYSAPMQITGAWELDQELWKCKAKRLWKTDGKYQTRENATEIDLYAPCDNDTPTPGIGDKVFAVFRGVWEMVGGVGGTSKIYGVIKTEFTRPPDTGSDLASPATAAFLTACGRVEVLGKTYTETDGEWNYDLVSCFMLADTEYLVEGSLFELTKSQYVDENGDMQEWYIVINPPADYAVTLNGTIIAGQQGTFNIGSHAVDVYGNLIPAGYRCADEVNGYPQDYIVERRRYGDTYRLYITGGTCPRIIST